jgi:hypothetical protein
VTAGVFESGRSVGGSATRLGAALLVVVSACGAQVRPSVPTRSNVAPGGGLTRAAVDEVIAGHLPAVRACYEKSAAAEGRPMGVVRLGWRVEPSGEVSSVTLVASSLNSASVEVCVAGEIARWRFPSSARETEVREHPFSF